MGITPRGQQNISAVFLSVFRISKQDTDLTTIQATQFQGHMSTFLNSLKLANNRLVHFDRLDQQPRFGCLKIWIKSKCFLFFSTTLTTAVASERKGNISELISENGCTPERTRRGVDPHAPQGRLLQAEPLHLHLHRCCQHYRYLQDAFRLASGRARFLVQK